MQVKGHIMKESIELRNSTVISSTSGYFPVKGSVFMLFLLFSN